MADLRTREYKPGVSPLSRRIHQKDWDSHKERIHALHEARYRHKVALEILRKECQERCCSFAPSLGQFRAQLAIWNLYSQKSKLCSVVEDEAGIKEDHDVEMADSIPHDDHQSRELQETYICDEGFCGGSSAVETRTSGERALHEHKPSEFGHVRASGEQLPYPGMTRTSSRILESVLLSGLEWETSCPINAPNSGLSDGFHHPNGSRIETENDYISYQLFQFVSRYFGLFNAIESHLALADAAICFRVREIESEHGPYPTLFLQKFLTMEHHSALALLFLISVIDACNEVKTSSSNSYLSPFGELLAPRVLETGYELHAQIHPQVKELNEANLRLLDIVRLGDILSPHLLDWRNSRKMQQYTPMLAVYSTLFHFMQSDDSAKLMDHWGFLARTAATYFSSTSHPHGLDWDSLRIRLAFFCYQGFLDPSALDVLINETTKGKSVLSEPLSNTRAIMDRTALCLPLAQLLQTLVYIALPGENSHQSFDERLEYAQWWKEACDNVVATRDCHSQSRQNFVNFYYFVFSQRFTFVGLYSHFIRDQLALYREFSGDFEEILSSSGWCQQELGNWLTEVVDLKQTDFWPERNSLARNQDGTSSLPSVEVVSEPEKLSDGAEQHSKQPIESESIASDTVQEGYLEVLARSNISGSSGQKPYRHLSSGIMKFKLPSADVQAFDSDTGSSISWVSSNSSWSFSRVTGMPRSTRAIEPMETDAGIPRIGGTQSLRDLRLGRLWAFCRDGTLLSANMLSANMRSAELFPSIGSPVESSCGEDGGSRQDNSGPGSEDGVRV